MSDVFPVDDPFHDLEGRDGFHVIKVEQGQMVMLSCMLYGGGMPFNMISEDPLDVSVEIVEKFDPTPKEKGEIERLQMVLVAVARYLTLGGTWREFDNALKSIEKLARGGMVYPGYYYQSSELTRDGYQHVFVKDDGTTDAVLWQEPYLTEGGIPAGGWIDATTLEKIQAEIENDETAWSETQEGEAGGSTRPANLLRIQAKGNPEAS